MSDLLPFTAFRDGFYIRASFYKQITLPRRSGGMTHFVGPTELEFAGGERLPHRRRPVEGHLWRGEATIVHCDGAAYLSGVALPRRTYHGAG